MRNRFRSAKVGFKLDGFSNPMAELTPFERYQDLQRYVGWVPEDGDRVLAVGPLVAKHFAALVEDFYEEIDRHPEARKVITGGQAQVDRLKGTLVRWLQELFSGQYDETYVQRRCRIGIRHVELGLSQVYTIAAFSRVRSGLMGVIDREWEGDAAGLLATRMSLNRLLDLDLALIEDAYQRAFYHREQAVQRLITIGHVAGGIAHELRNPLNIIKTSIYFLLNAHCPSPEKVRSHLQRIDRQVTSSDAVIAGLNNFARLPVPDMQRVDIPGFLKQLTDTLELPQNIEVQTECTENAGEIFGDPQQLSIVFLNLFRNACDAMPHGGHLRITATSAIEGIEISVCDSGMGMDEEILQRVMDPLFTTKARGIGLGLSISRAIIEKHYGRLTAVSESGRGTTFTVWLPEATDILMASNP